MIKQIITDINELRRPCELVTKEDDIKSIVIDLKDTLKEKQCLALTANQIGINKKISYLKIPKWLDNKIQYDEYVLINAKIIEKDRLIKVNNESCVSFPSINVITRRYVFVTVEYLDENFKYQVASFQDLISLVMQHEIAHQDGKVIFDFKWRAR